MIITMLDFRILNLIQRKMRCKFLDRVMPKISMIGNFGAVWIACAVLFLASSKYEDTGEKILCGLIAGVILGNLLLKHMIARPRPFKMDDTKSLLIKEPADYSFPSGHTLSSVISVCVILHTNVVFGAIAAVLCLLILFSRIYLFVHYPSDILGGIGLGFLISETVLKLNL